MSSGANRRQFLTALCSSNYLKGPIAIDTAGHPLDTHAPGWCVDGLAYTLFHDPARPGSVVPIREALGVSQATFARWQQEWNDSPLTFVEIADRIAADWQMPRY